MGEQILDDLSSLEKLKARQAPLKARILATTIDVSLFLPLFLMMLLLVGYYYALAVAAAFLAYNILLESSTWHATLGKRIMGLKVIREDGKLVSKHGAAVRSLVKCLIIAFPLPLLILHLFYIIMKDDRRKLIVHNKLAKTRVIQVVR
jgi:uncharacterized RDD family membrane protein YckC